MTSKDKYTKPLEDDEDESGGSTGTGTGTSGHIEFRDFLVKPDHRRDDLLSPEEKRRLLIVHRDVNEWRVKKQKETRDIRKQLKDGKISLRNFRQGLGGGGIASGYKANPALKDKAQFSGIDRQENMLPTENVSATNEEQRDELQARLENRLANTLKPGFNPKLKPY